jgi:hypothetical protein
MSKTGIQTRNETKLHSCFSKAKVQMPPMNDLDFRKIVLKENLTDDDGCAHQEGTTGTHSRDTDLRVGRLGGTQEALSGE